MIPLQIINPLITIITYTPYRLLIKGYLLYIPGNGNGSRKSFRSSNFGSFSKSLPRCQIEMRLIGGDNIEIVAI